jgi:hypothetical protein
VIWPSGLFGGSLKMLEHYVQMRHSESFPATVGSRVFDVAPKWAYLYWYWTDYKPFFLCYAIAIPGIVVLAALKALRLTIVPLVSLTAFLLFASHRAHIIGPEYLAHCLPFLTLLGGLGVHAAGKLWRPLATVALVLLAIPVVRWSPRVPLPGMDVYAHTSRWPAASRALATEWQPGDKIVVGSQPVSIAHWYLVYHGKVPSIDTQFQILPVRNPQPLFLQRLKSGFYRYVGVSNMFSDRVALDAKTLAILHDWTVIWRSEEPGASPSRLIIYRAPDRLPLLVPSPTPKPLNRP